ncbi:ubiquitin-like protein 3 [Meleagris gallopavo]|uniref:ubiquitin-like protein 3 n=1 Tax=Meleagris gallopavo TaxID=9103 RepID=UPI00093DE21E|nr:ubiquitin-like protein 3 [Meleagris gallopavo]
MEVCDPYSVYCNRSLEFPLVAYSQDSRYLPLNEQTCQGQKNFGSIAGPELLQLGGRGSFSSSFPNSTFYLQINLRLILVSGKTKEFLFSPNDSAADIAKHVYDNWPMDWEEEQVSSPNILRLIYQGRFLHGNVTLGALKLPFGKTTVMHLVARETLPEPNSQGQRNREKTGESNCCVIL